MLGKLHELLKKRGPFGLARAIINRLHRLTHWLIAIPLLFLISLVCALIVPFRRLRFGIFPTERIGHLALNPDLFMRRRWLNRGRSGADHEVTIFVAGNPANQQLLKMWQRELPIIRLPFLHAVLDSTRLLWSNLYFYEALDMFSNEYEEFNAAPPTLRFTRAEEAEGRRTLAEWGIDLDQDWFVCVFARDDRYLTKVFPGGDWGYHDFRDADIDSFNLAIEEIIARGGFVLRMGFHVRKPLSIKSDRVIDYARGLRSDFMDIFLPAKCRFFLGTTSGIADVAMVFDRPRIGVNWVPFGSAPWGKQSLCIPKLIVDATTGEPIPFGVLMKNYSQRSDRKIWDGEWALQQGYRHVDNTPEEILAVAREMLDRLDNRYQPSAEAEELQRIYFELIPKDHWCAGVKTPTGTEFLRTHRDLLVTSA